MNLGSRVLTFPLLAAFLVLLPAEGPCLDDPTKPKVTLTLTRVRGVEYSAKELEGKRKGQEVRHVCLSCEAVIDNQTGADLTVDSSFFSAFDGLGVVILRDGRKVAEQHYTTHQSPASLAPRPFVLNKGKTRMDLRFPLRLPPRDWAKLQAKLAGELPGSMFKGKLESNAVGIQRVGSLEP